jgi:prolyl oligopeptidase
MPWFILPRSDQIDDYAAPRWPIHRWLEEPDSPQTQAWVQAQNQVTFNWLSQI